MVVAHSFFYLKEILEYSWIIIFLALSTIELAYICLPYISKRNEGFIKYRYYAIIAALFLASVIPATLQTTKDFRHQLEIQSVAVPPKPVKSNLIAVYTQQVQRLSDEIAGNQEIIAGMIKNKFITKSEKLQRSNRSLGWERQRISKKQVALEEKYQTAIVTFNAKMEKIGVAIEKNKLTVWFDRIKLTWSLLVIIILQLANAAFIHHGSQLLIRPDEVTDIPEESVNSINNDDILNVDQFLEKFKVAGVGRHKAEQFLEKFNIKTLDDLANFVEDENVFKPLIKESFASETAIAYNRMCRVIKRRFK